MRYIIPYFPLQQLTNWFSVAFGRLARSIARIAPRTEKVDISQYLPGFAELLDLDDG